MITVRPLGSRQAAVASSLLKRSPVNARPTIQCSAATKVTPPLTAVRCKSGPYGYTQAKSLVFSKFGEPSDVLKIHTHSISPTLPANSVLLRTLAAPINPADVNTIQGTYGVKPAFSPLIGTTEPSVIPGNEGVFEVQASTTATPGLGRGDWVIPAKTGFGTWRTHAVVPADAVLPVNKAGLTPLQAATVAVNPCSAYRMLRDFVGTDSDGTALGRLSGLGSGSGNGSNGGATKDEWLEDKNRPMYEGDWFIQNGANSGVGRAAIQLGRLWGLRSINVVRARPTDAETRALKEELRGLGATHVVTEEEFLDRGFAERARRWTRGSRHGGVRLGLNCVGGRSAQAVAKALVDGGTVVTYGGMARQPVALPTGLLIFRDLRFRGFWLSRWADADRVAKKRTVDEILNFVRAGRFRDAPVRAVPWGWDTEEPVLRDAVQGTLEGFRGAKGVFVFEDEA